MQSKSKKLKQRKFPNSGFHLFVLGVLILGIFFRFVNIDRKIYEFDEVYTSLRISGYTMAEMEQELRNGQVISIKDLQKYQAPNPEKNLVDTIKGLALEESQLTPLYFILARFWVQWFGDSVAVTRSLSACISLLAFPAIYWLCQELFTSWRIGWIAMALIAISPVHVIYAQVARFYSLWTVLILLSSAALLRAIRVKTNLGWGIYSLTVILGIYTHLYFGLVAMGQGIYVISIKGFRFSKTLIYYILASLVGLITFSPWLLILITSPNPETLQWTQYKQPLFAITVRWVDMVRSAFMDIGVSPINQVTLKPELVPFILITLTSIIYAIYFICRNTPQRVHFFVLTLISSVGLTLVLADFIFQHRYGATKYILPSILGIQLAFAYLIATKLNDSFSHRWQQRLWKTLTSMLLGMGIISCTISAQAEIWWNSHPHVSHDIPSIADLVNQSPQPLVISDYDDLKFIQVLGYQLEPKVQLLLVEKPSIAKVPTGFSDVFLYRPSESLRTGLVKKYNTQIKRIYPPLWKLENHTR
ncbi:glycosyltransferase family 39 protein [Coleofasciculus sp. E2-BRE-01]|uniref:glycosyltransferase family 39 protein n=1 Tax=Coleofasciculus sp. E2-BRE-01 TaxID=3069524 RepID=UPI0032FE31ED